MKAQFEKTANKCIGYQKSKITKNTLGCDGIPKLRRANVTEINVRLLPVKDEN